ncbi:MAG: carboxypeptidase M32 [Chitinophagales bacterium]
MKTKYQKYLKTLQKAADIDSSIAVLSWDQETQLPAKGAKHRAQQIATLSGLGHEIKVSQELGDLLHELSEDSTLSAKQLKNIELSLEGYKKNQKFSTDFVMKMSEATSNAFQAWAKAREANDYAVFRPALEQMIDLKREQCEIIGYQDHPYDALLDQYEPKEKTADLNVLFADVRQQLVDFVKEISEKPQVEDSWMYKHYDKDKQWKFGIDVLKQMGYDFEAGRQDISHHPFTISFSPLDVRVTTRITENNFHEMLWSCIHEGGHALYEQGLPVEDYGLPTGETISLGIHESQSRLWENNVGRGLPFWKANYSALQQTFPENLGNVSLQDFYKSMNLVKPSLIRTNADELTYHFHILVRFEIEKALIEGNIEAKNLDEVWVEKYKEYLGIEVPSDREGILQDIHWSHGSLGYFPTYSLGSFYAAQFYAQANKDVPNLEAEIEAGNLMPMLEWLRTNVHQHGRLYTAEELCVNITGEKLNFKHFMDYAKVKYGGIYG